MKIFVCFIDYGYEGYSAPLEVFFNEDEAKDWVVKNKSKWFDAEYTEFDKEITND